MKGHHVCELLLPINSFFNTRLYLYQVIFDECHKAKNIIPLASGKPTKTAQCVLELQNRMPKARYVIQTSRQTCCCCCCCCTLCQS